MSPLPFIRLSGFFLCNGAGLGGAAVQKAVNLAHPYTDASWAQFQDFQFATEVATLQRADTAAGADSSLINREHAVISRIIREHHRILVNRVIDQKNAG